MSRCTVCGRRLSLIASIGEFFNRANKSYPFVAIDGARKEKPVRHLCERCAQRAEQHRRGDGEDQGDREDQEGAVGTSDAATSA